MIGENINIDQLRNNCTADQRLSFQSIDSTISPRFKSEISTLKQFFVAAHTVRFVSETRIVSFLARSLKYIVDALCPGQQFFNYIGKEPPLPG